MQTKLPEWNAQTPALADVADQMNRIVHAVNALTPLTTTGGARASAIAGAGTAVGLPIRAHAPGAVVKITGGSGSGQYTGRIFTGDAATVPGNSPNTPFNLNDPGSDDCLFLNLAEFDGTGPGGVQANGNLLLANQWAAGLRCGYTTGGSGQPLAIVAGTCRGPSRTWAGMAVAGFTWVNMVDAQSAVLNTFNAASVPWVAAQNVLAISVMRFRAVLSNTTTDAFLWASIFSDGVNQSTALSATVAPNSVDNNSFTGTITSVQLLQEQLPGNIVAQGIYSQAGQGPCTATGMQGQADIYVFGL